MARRFVLTRPQTYGVPTPYRILHDMRRQIDDVMDRGFDQDAGSDDAYSAAPGTRAFLPALDIERENDHYVITVETPGIAPEDIDIEIEDRALTISGEKTETREADDGSRRERQYGRFTRTIQLADDVDEDSIEASSEHGVLSIRLPKRVLAEGEKRRIEVRTGNEKPSKPKTKSRGKQTKAGDKDK